jgi:phage-related tail fiber protein
MSQHDFEIANQSFPATRTDLNLALLAAVSNSSGADAPTTTYANQFWYETDTNILYIRSEANDAWVVVLNLDTALTSTNTELNQLAAITRGSLLYGNASGATARLAKGAASTVLTSDGTDIAWAAPAVPVGVPSGTVIYHAANTAPTSFLKANGAAVSRSTYSDLFTAVGTTFGVGDGSSTFNVPDLRGEFMRGWDDSRNVDGSRAFGSAQADQMEQHNHIDTNRPLHVGYGFGSGAITVRSPADTQQGNVSSFLGNRGGTSNSSENRPRNVAMLACIKY